jgi:hypothetical protein
MYATEEKEAAIDATKAPGGSVSSRWCSCTCLWWQVTTITADVVSEGHGCNATWAHVSGRHAATTHLHCLQRYEHTVPKTSTESRCPCPVCAAATSCPEKMIHRVHPIWFAAGVMAQHCMERMTDVPQHRDLFGVLLPTCLRLILPSTGAWATGLSCCQSIDSGAARPEHCFLRTRPENCDVRDSNPCKF